MTFEDVGNKFIILSEALMKHLVIARHETILLHNQSDWNFGDCFAKLRKARNDERTGNDEHKAKSSS